METVRECLNIVDRRLETAIDPGMPPRAALLGVVDAVQLLRKVVEAVARKQGLHDMGVPR